MRHFLPAERDFRDVWTGPADRVDGYGEGGHGEVFVLDGESAVGGGKAFGSGTDRREKPCRLLRVALPERGESRYCCWREGDCGGDGMVSE